MMNDPDLCASPEPGSKSSFQEVLDLFLGAERILLSSHVGVDGDSAGAALALIEAGRRLGKTVHYANAVPPPALLDFLPDYDRLAAPIPVDARHDLGIILDTSAPARLGSVWPLLEPLPRAVIDHHEGNGGAAATAWIDPRAAAVTVMIAEMIEAMGLAIDRTLALPLYVGLVTDTSLFQQTNTDERAMRWGGRFIAAGVEPFDVATRLYESRRLAAVRLSGLALSRAEIDDDVCHTRLTLDDYRALEADDADTEGVIQALRTVGDVRVVILLREQEKNQVKVTLRAKDETDVATVARDFGGGGHRAAAGFTVDGEMAEILEKVLARFKENAR
jgi:phosphoesterase RecJ-like protein